MRILLIACFYPPQHAVASLRTHSFARTWAGLGHDVTVLTTEKRVNQRGMPRPSDGIEVVEVPYRGPRAAEWLRALRRSRGAAPANAAAATAVTAAPDDRADLAEAASGTDAPDQTTLERWGERFRSRHGVFAARRMPDLSDGWVRPAIDWARGHGPWDLAVSSSGPYTPHLIGLALRSEGCVGRWVADFRDLWVDNHLGGGIWPFTVRERALQRRVLAGCDLAVTVSDALAETLRASDGIGDSPVGVVHNGFDPQEFDRIQEAAARRQPAGERTDPLQLVYTGSVHPHGQHAGALFEAIARRRSASPGARPVEVVVAGSPAEPWRVWAERAGAGDALRTLGVRPRADALALQQGADALLSVAWSGPRTGGLSGKVFEYLAWTAPILVIGGPPEAPIVDLVRRCGRGRHLGDDPATIATALDKLAEGRLEVGPPDHERIGCFARPAQARRLLDLASAPALAGPSDAESDAPCPEGSSRPRSVRGRDRARATVT